MLDINHINIGAIVDMYDMRGAGVLDEDDMEALIAVAREHLRREEERERQRWAASRGERPAK